MRNCDIKLMVSFNCAQCGIVLKKKQIDRHCEQACRNAWDFICVGKMADYPDLSECGKVFSGFEYKDHPECMTET